MAIRLQTGQNTI